MDGNTSDRTTLKEFLAKIEKQYGKAKRTWVMDRGVPTGEVLAEMRNSEPPIHYLVGSPRGRLTQLEKAFLTKPWEDVRKSVRVRCRTTGSFSRFSAFFRRPTWSLLHLTIRSPLRIRWSPANHMQGAMASHPHVGAMSVPISDSSRYGSGIRPRIAKGWKS